MEKEKKLEAIREYLGDSVELIDENDSFDFKCQQCGRCCMNREDIILNPFDVYNGAKYLGITTAEFLKKYTTPLKGSVSKIPMIVLSCDERGYCPLLEFDIKDGCKFKCKINPAKPGACSNHPIGIIREKDILANQENFSFIKTTQCDNSKGHSNMNIVKDWCKPYLDNREDIAMAHELQTLPEDYFPCRYLDLIGAALMHNADSIENIKKMTEDSIVLDLFLLTTGFQAKFIEVAYSNYDTSKPFAEQAKTKKVELEKNLLKPVRNILYAMTKSMNEDLREKLRNKLENTVDIFMQEYEKNNETGGRK